MYKKGFTLAEVLITLMIIGIVAALTIPSVISNYQQQEFKTGLKKAVSVLNEAIQTNIAQDGETPYENGDLFSYLQRHMSVLKTMSYSSCYDSQTGRALEPNSPSECSGGFYTNKAFYTTDGMRFELAGFKDGQEFYLHESKVNINQPRFDGYHSWGSNGIACGSYGLSNNVHNTVYPPCLVTVDVNGDKKPNPQKAFVQGNQAIEYLYPLPTDKKLTDVFNILITDEKAIPFGVVAQRAMYSK